jgi:alpha-N-arabinofuranosidase
VELISLDLHRLTAWEVVNGVSLSVVTSAPVSSSLPNGLQVTIASGTSGTVAFANTGYWGIKVTSGSNYTGSFYVKSSNYAGPISVSLQGASSKTVYATTTPVSKVTSTYTKYTFTLIPTSSAPDSNNIFVVHLTASGASTTSFGLFSLFPPTYKNRPNGMRVDLATVMAATSPKIWRFPGGNNLEGETIATRWKWNETIGP